MALSEQLLAKKRRPTVIAELVEVVEQEVAAKKGMSGAALRAGYRAASKVVPQLTHRSLDKLLPDLARALDPFWTDFESAGGVDFGGYLAAHSAEVSAALLAVTDAKVQASRREQVKKVYQAIRGRADGHVQAALPRVGTVLQRHAARVRRPARRTGSPQS